MSEKTEILYNASCPICSSEVDQYAKMSERQALPIRYDDLSDPEVLADWGISRDDAARRFHVRKNGQTYGGIPAFVVLWRDLPQMRWLARIVSLPVIYQLACVVYDYAAAPLLYWLHKRRERRG
ncbi:thiol-disulfide oxidoreductase DCC family protein [Sulfitobacter sp. S190]|uniref:thiol-disulfide oxidoreductase DCC family protein n=1 Tax=Sulfitobacter sp. S190 TaxID=2867022 RepID=UPI0021A47460|nr:DUF393 domain-containing protein [Sulfitobacter sp. S190]UWR21650.1 DUF393 domain-containing protein [Sulfitobacter sp. S190]